ncbi:MAG: hypothetical protein V1933_07205 [Candidatus Omnitrophota bacterium]
MSIFIFAALLDFTNNVGAALAVALSPFDNYKQRTGLPVGRQGTLVTILTTKFLTSICA